MKVRFIGTKINAIHAYIRPHPLPPLLQLRLLPIGKGVRGMGTIRGIFWLHTLLEDWHMLWWS